jgi:hypothetical protein
MFISKFSTENWQGKVNEIRVEAFHTWAQIETAIRELDGQNKTLVTLEADNESHMVIGGGVSKYIVYLTFDNDIFDYLFDPSQPDREEILVVGGQAGIYHARLCVPIEMALKAAQAFAEFGIMEKSLLWKRDSAVELV